MERVYFTQLENMILRFRHSCKYRLLLPFSRYCCWKILKIKKMFSFFWNYLKSDSGFLNGFDLSFCLTLSVLKMLKNLIFWDSTASINFKHRQLDKFQIWNKFSKKVKIIWQIWYKFVKLHSFYKEFAKLLRSQTGLH